MRIARSGKAAARNDHRKIQRDEGRAIKKRQRSGEPCVWFVIHLVGSKKIFDLQVLYLSSVCKAFADVVASKPAAVVGRAMQFLFNIQHCPIVPTRGRVFVCYLITMNDSNTESLIIKEFTFFNTTHRHIVSRENSLTPFHPALSHCPSALTSICLFF